MVDAMPPFPNPASQAYQRRIVLADGTTIPCLGLQPGLVGLSSLQHLHAMLEAHFCAKHIVLLSDHSVPPALLPPQEQEWLLLGGSYRRLQEAYKARGGLLISLVDRMLIGGSYLVHGMAAHHRFIYPHTRVYPSLAPEVYEAIFKRPYPHPDDAEKALTTGVVTHIATDWDNFLTICLPQILSSSKTPKMTDSP